MVPPKSAEIQAASPVAIFESFRLYLCIVVFVIETKSITSDIIMSDHQPVTCASYISKSR
jgi:hypothetical protein